MPHSCREKQKKSLLREKLILICVFSFALTATVDDDYENIHTWIECKRDEKCVKIFSIYFFISVSIRDLKLFLIRLTFFAHRVERKNWKEKQKICFVMIQFIFLLAANYTQNATTVTSQKEKMMCGNSKQ